MSLFWFISQARGCRNREHQHTVADGQFIKRGATGAGVDHIGIGLPGFESLIDHYDRLKTQGITPDLCVNHLFNTSFYYYDPDGNEVELTADNMSSKPECSAFLNGAQMSELSPPFFGYQFDPADMPNAVRSGLSLPDLARFGALDGPPSS